MEGSTEDSVAVPVIAGGRRLIGFLVVILLVAGVSLAAGTLIRSPDEAALAEVDQNVPVVYVVENRVIAAGVTLPGRIVSGQTRNLLSQNQSASRQVITRTTLVVGQLISAGTLLAEVSGRPQIAIPDGVPLYRDLANGAQGADVSAFQEALIAMGQRGVSSTGEVGPRTLQATRAQYEALGASLPGGASAVIPWTDFVNVPIGATVVAAPAVGTVLDPDSPMAVVKTSPDVIVVRATGLEAEKLPVGQIVDIGTTAGAAESTVLSVGPFTVDEVAGGGYEISVAIPSNLDAIESQAITVRQVMDAEPVPAVPLVALRQDEEGTYVRVIDRGNHDSANPGDRPGALAATKVYVKVTAQAEGWAALSSETELPVGSRVLVSS